MLYPGRKPGDRSSFGVETNGRGARVNSSDEQLPRETAAAGCLPRGAGVCRAGSEAR